MRAYWILFPAALVFAAPGFAQDRSPVVVIGVEDEGLREAIAEALPAREAPETLFQAERMSAEAGVRATALLRSEGYYQAVVTAEPQEEPLGAQIVVSAGPRFVLESPELVFDGEALDPAGEAAARAALARLSAGAPARAAAVLEAEAAMLQALRDAGYADAALGDRSVIIDHATLTMRVTARATPGPRVALGEVALATPEALDLDLAQRFAAFEAGQTFRPEALSETRRALSSAGAFSRVRVTLAPTSDETGLRDVIVALEPEERRSVEVGLSWSSSEGAGGEVLWTARNVLRRAETARYGVALAERRQALSATFQLPRAGGEGQTAILAAALAREDQGPFNRDALEASITFEAPREGAWRPSYGASAALDFYSETAGVENAAVLSAFGEALYDSTDNPLDAREGFEARLRVEPSVSFGDAFTGFARVIGEGRVFHTPEERDWLTIAARTRVGWIEPISGSSNDLPIDRLFYAGGGGSVRGYAFNSIFPESRQRAGLAPGGRGLLEGSIEARARFGERWGAVAFFDAGSAFDDPGEMSGVRAGAGLGVRYDLGFAPLRLDVAAPLDRRATDDRVVVYVSIGQAF
jgi:translocation and assembly module TamA